MTPVSSTQGELQGQLRPRPGHPLHPVRMAGQAVTPPDTKDSSDDNTNDQIITAASELAMAHRAHSHITLFHGGSHLTLISHPNAVTAVIASAVCSLR
jgi:hypothetical protein